MQFSNAIQSRFLKAFHAGIVAVTLLIGSAGSSYAQENPGESAWDGNEYASARLISATTAVGQDEALRLRQSGEVLSFQTILRHADERYPGARLLEAELDDDDGELIYEIELLTRDGVVRELEIDARSGRLLEDEVDD